MSSPTWSDLNSPSLVPPLGARKAPDMGPAAVMVSTEPDVRHIRKCLGHPRSSPFFMGGLFHGALPLPGVFRPFSREDTGVLPSLSPSRERVKAEAGIGEKAGPFLPNGSHEPIPVFVGPYMGAPYAVMLLESLIARGVKQVIVFGWCGGIADDFEVGDIVLPDSAIAQEGTSANYMEKGQDFPVIPCPAGAVFSQKVRTALDRADIPYHTGRIWTTDAIYRETAEKVSFFKDRSALAVEMECSALFAVAAFRQVELVALLVVSDRLTTEKWHPAFRSEAFTRSRKALVQWLTGCWSNYHG